MPYYNAADRRARARDAWHSEWISKSGLKARLWTDKVIAEFLGKPEKAGPIMAWRRKDVQKAERSPEGWQSAVSGLRHMADCLVNKTAGQL